MRTGFYFAYAGFETEADGLHKVAGVIMELMGILMATNSLSALFYRMLEVFPAPGGLGGSVLVLHRFHFG